MKKFRKRIRIENATAFKLEYFEGAKEIKTKEFKSLKAMEQFHSRQTGYFYLDLNRFALVNEKWHLFIKLDTPFVFKSELDRINKIFNEKFEVESLQNFENEEN